MNGYRFFLAGTYCKEKKKRKKKRAEKKRNKHSKTDFAINHKNSDFC